MDELLSPKLDIVFKKLFSEHLDLLRDFVASMLSIPLSEIQNLVLTNPEMIPEESDAKFSRLDLRICMDNRQIDIEIQIRKFLGFADRALFYWAKLFTADLKAGEEYCRLKQAITINLLDFDLFENRTEVHTEVIPVIKGTQMSFSDKMSLHFFELKKVGKIDSVDLAERMAIWLKFLNVKKSEELDMFKDDDTMNKASDVLREMSGDARMREAARLREKRLHDEASELTSAREEGKIEGIKEGKIEGIKEGRKEGGLKMLIDLVKAGDLSLKTASRKAQMSETDFQLLCTKA